VRSGQKVGKYVLGERIARGGMAEVWAARVEGPEGFVKSVALKFVVDPGDPEMERLFVNEARVAAGLQHPNLVTVFDFDRVIDATTELGGHSPGRYYIAMERIEGHDLRHVLRTTRERGQRFPVDLALHVAGEVLKGLRYLHERPPSGGTRGPILVHRDVSPHNILIAYAGDVKLSDFGIAKVVTRVPGAESGLVRGKVAYASPEQVLGQPVDHRSDQFSLGVTLWEMLAGQRLFGGTTDVETMNRVLAGDIPELPRALGIAREIEGFVRRMLAASPDARHPTTAVALSGLTALPGYPGDGASLGDWMLAALPPRAAAVLPATQLLPLSELDPAQAGGRAVAGSTLWLDGGSGAGQGIAAEPRRPVGEPGRAGTPSRSAAVHAPAAPRAPGAAASRSGSIAPRRTPVRRSAPVLIDFATRAPLGAARSAWGRWGVVAAAVALLAWGAAVGLRRFASGAAVASPAQAARPARTPRATREERALARDLRAEVVAAPARSAEPAALAPAPPPVGRVEGPPGPEPAALVDTPGAAAAEGVPPASGARGAEPGDEAPVAAEDEAAPEARASRHDPSAVETRDDPAASRGAGSDEDRSSRSGSGWPDTAPLGRHPTTERGPTGVVPNGAPIIE
jgi:serine/threonine-protein kinase